MLDRPRRETAARRSPLRTPSIPLAGAAAPDRAVESALKRLLDLGLTTLALALTWPLWLLIAAVIKLDSPGPVLFRSTRVGRQGRHFTMYKFRTMSVDAEALLPQIAHLNLGGPYMIKIPNDPRVTRVGRFLRRSGLDELPQLWHVLRGEMSLVGPRPQAPHEVALYTPHQRRRLAAVPGLTGLWQVTARDNPSFDEWVRLDLEYIDHWSLGLDLRIMWRTFAQMFTRGEV